MVAKDALRGGSRGRRGNYLRCWRQGREDVRGMFVFNFVRLDLCAWSLDSKMSKFVFIGIKTKYLSNPSVSSKLARLSLGGIVLTLVGGGSFI